MRLIEIDSVKALAIVGVVIAHMSFESRFEKSALELIHTLQMTFGWCVLAFFFCSGLLAKPIKDKYDAISFIKKRFVRLVVPGIVFSITYRVIRSGLFLTGKFAWESPIPASLSDVIYFCIAPEGPQFYFLYYLFAVAVIVALLDWILPRGLLLLIAGLLLPVSYMFTGMMDRAFGPELAIMPMYFFSYFFGQVLFSQASLDERKWIYLGGFASLTLTAFISKSLVVGYALMPCLLWELFKASPWLGGLVEKTKLGHYSSAIYVWHAPVLMSFSSVFWVKLVGGGVVVLLPIIGSTLLGCILLSEITNRVKIFKIWRF